MIVTLLILAVSAVCFMSGRIRSDMVALCVLLALVLTGILTPDEALSGFSNSVVIMMAGLFVVGGAIFQTGLAKMISSRILKYAGTSELRLFLLVMLVTAFVGAFVSNTGTVALMLPIVVSMAAGARISASRLLMPLAFASSMGGMMTLIGTPPNLVIQNELIQAGYEPLKFFSFTPVGVLCVVVGVLVLLPLSRYFLSKPHVDDAAGQSRKSLDQLAAEYRLNAGLTRWTVQPGSPVVGRSVASLDVYRRFRLTVLEVRRVTGGQPVLLKRVNQYLAGADVLLEAGDVLYVLGEKDDAQRFADQCSMQELSVGTSGGGLDFYDIGIAELLLLPTSKTLNRTVQEIDFRSKFHLNVLGIRRHQTYILDNLKEQRFHSGDTLLVQGSWESIARLARETDEWVVLGQPLEEAARVTLDYKAPVAALIMLLMVVMMAFDFIPVAPVTAVLLAAVLMAATGCFRNGEAVYKTINWESIILFAAMLPMSVALQKTGTSDFLSTRLVSGLGDYGPFALMGGVYFATSLLTMFISNTVTAVLMAPIAMQAALRMEVSPVPFLFAVTVAASMCFASPFSTPPNTLVMPAGGYKFSDYLKVGLPLQVIMGLVMIFALPLLFPFR